MGSEQASGHLFYGVNEGERRRWHTRVVGVDRPEKEDALGAIVWLGEIGLRKSFPRLSLETFTSYYGALIFKRVSFFSRKHWNWECGVPDENCGPLTHPLEVFLAPRYDGEVYGYPDNNCGDFWVGIAHFPLPTDWVDPTSSWVGWTHLLHADEHKEAEKVFNFVADRLRIDGYPENPKQLTREIIDFLGPDLKKLGKKKAYWMFPWLNPKLMRHPLSGKLLTKSD